MRLPDIVSAIDKCWTMQLSLILLLVKTHLNAGEMRQPLWLPSKRCKKLPVVYRIHEKSPSVLAIRDYRHVDSTRPDVREP